MLKLRPVMVAKEVVDATQSTIEDFKAGIISGEVSMTDRLLGAICSALDGRHIGNLKWRARTLKAASGRGAEEERHGADVLGVLEVILPDYSVTKGFLWQAKIIEPGEALPNKQWERFQKQCRKMLKRTDHAFAVIYSRIDGVRIIPAQQILEIDRNQVYELGSRSLHGFFKGHVKCEIGDRKLNSPTIETLDRLIDHPDQTQRDSHFLT